MPEISEVARIVHFLRQHLKGRRIASITAEDDPIVYGKVGTSADAFKKALTGRTVVDAKQQGKYFWLEMDKPPHPLMHFGMTGWVKLRNIETDYYSPRKDVDGKAKGKKQSKLKVEDGDEKEGNAAISLKPADEAWPPRFHKFVLKMEGQPAIEAAFVDARRLGRIRLVNVPASQMRTSSPLKENGPDPVIDKDILTEEWLKNLVHSKKSPIKAVLLDQANISGVGNWVGDEILYHAAIHPEQYSNTLSDAQCKKLYESLMYVCDTSCELLGDSHQFPAHWMMRHRWNKGKDASKTLPNGAKMTHITVGGRTSCLVPSVQKKSGSSTGDEEDAADEDSADEPVEENKSKPKPQKQSKKSTNETANGTTSARKRKSSAVNVKEESSPAPSKKTKASTPKKQVNGASSSPGGRRSARTAKR